MRGVVLVLMACMLAGILFVAGCAKKTAAPDGGGQVQNGGVKHVAGTCVVCNKQSDKLFDFQVPFGPKVKVCAPDVNPDCVSKVGQNPEKFGGKSSGAVPPPPPPTGKK